MSKAIEAAFRGQAVSAEGPARFFVTARMHYLPARRAKVTARWPARYKTAPRSMLGAKFAPRDRRADELRHQSWRGPIARTGIYVGSEFFRGVKNRRNLPVFAADENLS